MIKILSLCHTLLGVKWLGDTYLSTITNSFLSIFSLFNILGETFFLYTILDNL